MFETAIAQLRFGYSMMTGRPFHLGSLEAIIDAMLETQREFGAVGADGAELIGGPTLDDDTRHDMQLRRFRAQALRAARETDYYGQLFRELDLDLDHLSHDDIARIPPTPKRAVRDDPSAFVRRSANVAFRTTTTGTTGKPTSTFFSQREMRTTVALNAMTFLLRAQITPADIVQVSTSSRATLGNNCFTRACERIGAVWYQAGLVAPDHALGLLAERHRIPGKVPQASYLNTYASYLGQLVECGLANGYGPSDFGLRTISVGGEVVTQGLLARARELFGEVEYTQGFGMTETWPFGGACCDQGHLHFEAPHGLLEVLSLETSAPALHGELGTMVATPFPPFRDASVVLRYDTQDVVRPVEPPLTCNMSRVPACSDIEGKLRLTVRHDDGLTTPRQVLEALEALACVPLPARCGFWADDGGVAVEVITRDDSRETRQAIGDSLEARGVPLRSLFVRTDRDELEHPYPLRGDLREVMFARS